MNISPYGQRIGPYGQKTITLPWGKGVSIPSEYLSEELLVRSVISKVDSTASFHLLNREQALWGNDLDPDPGRVLRTAVEREEKVLASIEIENPEKPKAQQRPARMTVQNASHSMQTKAEWSAGELIKLEWTRKNDASVRKVTLVVNDNGTLTYTDATNSDKQRER